LALSINEGQLPLAGASHAAALAPLGCHRSPLPHLGGHHLRVGWPV